MGVLETSPLIPVLWGQKQAYLCAFQDSLIYIERYFKKRKEERWALSYKTGFGLRHSEGRWLEDRHSEDTVVVGLQTRAGGCRFQRRCLEAPSQDHLPYSSGSVPPTLAPARPVARALSRNPQQEAGARQVPRSGWVRVRSHCLCSLVGRGQ